MYSRPTFIGSGDGESNECMGLQRGGDHAEGSDTGGASKKGTGV